MIRGRGISFWKRFECWIKNDPLLKLNSGLGYARCVMWYIGDFWNVKNVIHHWLLQHRSSLSVCMQEVQFECVFAVFLLYVMEFDHFAVAEVWKSEQLRRSPVQRSLCQPVEGTLVQEHPPSHSFVWFVLSSCDSGFPVRIENKYVAFSWTFSLKSHNYVNQHVYYWERNTLKLPEFTLGKICCHLTRCYFFSCVQFTNWWTASCLSLGLTKDTT